MAAVMAVTPAMPMVFAMYTPFGSTKLGGEVAEL